MELHLLIEATDSEGDNFVTIEGKKWTLSKPYDLGKLNDVPTYACISYAWGKEEQVANPFHPTHRISPNTIPALTAAIRTHKSEAFWIDALCIPFDQPQRRLTLESMGYIYHSAAAVITVLSDASFAAIERVSNAEQLTYDIMYALEQDKWVSSVWTYQEVINNDNVYLTTLKEAGNKIVAVEDFLNIVGNSLDKWKRHNGMTGLQMRNMFPRLDALEDLLADWVSNAIGYGVMNSFMLLSNMERRVTDTEENRWYSMMCVLTQEPSRWLSDMKFEHLSVTFMALCESMNDFSYIYSSADRDTNNLKRRWSPKPGPLPSIFAFHSFGEPQKGRIEPEGLLLDKVLSFCPSDTLSEAARNLIIQWLVRPDFARDPEVVLAIKLLAALKDAGFKGVGGPLITEKGIFLPQQSLDRAGEVQVLASGTIRWVFGAPALAMLTKESDITYVPGIFVGVIKMAEARPMLLR